MISERNAHKKPEMYFAAAQSALEFLFFASIDAPLNAVVKSKILIQNGKTRKNSTVGAFLVLAVRIGSGVTFSTVAHSSYLIIL